MIHIYIWYFHVPVRHCQVQFTGGDNEDVVHNVAANFQHREILQEMIVVCAKLWKLQKPPSDFLAEQAWLS